VLEEEMLFIFSHSDFDALPGNLAAPNTIIPRGAWSRIAEKSDGGL
jgi:hypothetical protein